MTQYTLTLEKNLKDVEPGQPRSVYARVTNALTYAPKSGAQVSLKVDVEANTGGHAHHDALRPKGTLSGAVCDPPEKYCVTATTNLNGYALFTFTAPPVSGTHTITAACVSPACTGTETGKINVMVPGLQEIPVTAGWVLIKKPGATHNHGHYLNSAAMGNLRLLAGNYTLNFPGQYLHLNDASLEWGGLFDVHGNWQSGYHSKHRLGKVIDIRANAVPGAIPEKNFDKLTVLAVKLKRSINVQIPHCSKGRSYAVDKCVGDENRHFHVLLLGEEG